MKLGQLDGTSWLSAPSNMQTDVMPLLWAILQESTPTYSFLGTPCATVTEGLLGFGSGRLLRPRSDSRGVKIQKR